MRRTSVADGGICQRRSGWSPEAVTRCLSSASTSSDHTSALLCDQRTITASCSTTPRLCQCAPVAHKGVRAVEGVEVPDLDQGILRARNEALRLLQKLHVRDRVFMT
jgi:putative component of membrane protein insertase Oxa1/YidC/SpoIIIJ protein YidD